MPRTKRCCRFLAAAEPPPGGLAADEWPDGCLGYAYNLVSFLHCLISNFTAMYIMFVLVIHHISRAAADGCLAIVFSLMGLLHGWRSGCSW